MSGDRPIPIIRNNVQRAGYVEGQEQTIVINRYSNDVVKVLERTLDIAERHGHHVARVEHFIEALFSESDARRRLLTLGYEDNDEARAKRFRLLSRREFVAGGVPADALGMSDTLRAWLDVAKLVAERRPAEHWSIIVDDFFDLALFSEAAEIRAISSVLEQYRRPSPTSIEADVFSAMRAHKRQIEFLRILAGVFSLPLFLVVSTVVTPAVVSSSRAVVIDVLSLGCVVYVVLLGVVIGHINSLASHARRRLKEFEGAPARGDAYE